MFQEVMIHQSFEPNCVSKSFTFLMISKLKFIQIETTDTTLELAFLLDAFNDFFCKSFSPLLIIDLGSLD